jgi:proteasome lid subunit RPN8/RPN11
MLSLSYNCHKALREDVERAYPEEACGVLLGRRGEIDDEVERIVVCLNVDSERRRRYSIAPEELIAAQKRARQEGMEILGFYHSHPDHSAEASAADLKEAHWTGCVYLICGVEKGKLVEVAARRLVEPMQWEEEKVHFAPFDAQK